MISRVKIFWRIKWKFCFLSTLYKYWVSEKNDQKSAKIEMWKNDQISGKIEMYTKIEQENTFFEVATKNEQRTSSSELANTKNAREREM